MRLVGFPTVTVSASGRASRRDVRVILAIDRPTSMAGYYTGLGTGGIQDMAAQFVNGFAAGRDEVGW